MNGEWLARYRFELVHAVRITAASVLAFVLVYAFGRSEGLWAVITAIVVTQSSVGGSLRTAFDQLVGSLFGASYATAVALAVSPDDLLSTAATLVVALAVPSVMAAFSPGFRIAPITAAIMLLGHAGPDVGPIGMAISRVMEVGLGCVVGLVVSVLVVPTRASRSVGDAASQLADLLAGQLEALASGRDAARTRIGLLAARTREGLSYLEALADEADRERKVRLSAVPDAMPVVRTMRRLRHDVDMLRRASAREAGQEPLPPAAAEAWVRSAEAGAAVLREIGPDLAIHPESGSRDMAEAVRLYRTALDEMRRTGEMRSLSTAALGRLFGIGFALEQFRRDLDDLVKRSREFSNPRRAGPVNVPA